MKALGWFSALFTFWMALLLTGSEAAVTDTKAEASAPYVFEEGKDRAARAGTLSGSELEGALDPLAEKVMADRASAASRS